MVGCRVCAVCAFCNVVTGMHSLAQARLRWGPALQQPSRRHVLFSFQCVGERKRRDGKLFFIWRSTLGVLGQFCGQHMAFQ